MPGGLKEFSFPEKFLNLSYSRFLNARCAQEKISEGTKLRRDRTFGKIEEKYRRPRPSSVEILPREREKRKLRREL